MSRGYHHLSGKERDHVAVLRSRGFSLRAMARVLGRAPATLSRELRRNAPPIHSGYYLPHKAQARAEARWRTAVQRPRLRDPWVRGYVTRQLRRGWSPELIAGRLTRLRPTQAISHEAIAQWLYAEARDLIPCLVRRHTKAHIPARATITYDNGSENIEHLLVNQVLGTRSYFCTPYTSQERGTVENTAGLVRALLPETDEL